VCRASAGACDLAESCPGNAADCPADAKSTALCRAAAGACDAAESCDGINDTCPPDAKSTALCRAASGVCDLAENCDGVNDACPADAVEPGGTPCRATAGFCDVAEFCDGTNKQCPTDAFEPSSTECRASAGVCDPAENCTGSGATCPADAKSTSECRASAGACDIAESCDGSNDDCPADAVASSSTVCRAAASSCDVAENCDGSGVDCPADLLATDGTPCPDGVFCNGAETCQSGTCSAGTDPCPVICDEANDQCLFSGCPIVPEPGCRTSLKSVLLIKNKTDNTKDKLIWKWIKGQSTTQNDFADPTSTANYAFCLYSGTTSALVAEIDVPPSGSKWKLLGTKGYKYLDSMATEDGAQKITLKGSSSNKSKVLVKGRGSNLPDPIDGGPLALPVKAQLINHDTAVCFESNFIGTPKKNTSALFKAKAP
jgi:hypothetical protein